MSRFIHNRIFVVGKISPGIINLLTTRWIASFAHHYETVAQLNEFGEMTLRRGDFNTLLIGDGVSPDDRREILGVIEQREGEFIVGVMTQEPSYESWLPISPAANAHDIADKLQFTPRTDPAQIIIVSSTKGGVGKSTISTNIAITLSQTRKPDGSKYRVALIDDDRTTRSIRSLMGIEDSAQTTADLVAEVNAARGVVTRDLVEKYLIKAHNVETLIGPHTIITDFPIEIDTSRDVLIIMAMELGYDFIIIDSPPDFINTSSFTYGILRDEILDGMRHPLVLVPVVPEKILLRSVDDTLTALNHFQHPTERIWPIINCMRPTHDPETIRGHHALWREPITILPYIEANEFVGSTGRPLSAEEAENAIARLIRGVFLGQGTIQEFQDSFAGLAEVLIKYMEETSAHSLS